MANGSATIERPVTGRSGRSPLATLRGPSGIRYHFSCRIAANRSTHMKIGAIVVHCHEFDRMLEFWRSALRYEPREPASGDWVVLRDPEGSGPNLSLQARDRPSGRRSWLHLDLYADDRDGEVERLVGLGARRYPWRYRPNADFVVLEDPDGNLFCVVQQGS